MKTIKISNNEILSLLDAEATNFPKNATQILNLANQNAQGTRPSVVGQMSDLIQEFPAFANLPSRKQPFMRHLIITVIILCVLTSCKKYVELDKNNPDLPAYSEEGANTGGCLINDTAWLNFKESQYGWFVYPLEITSYPNGDSLLILFRGYTTDRTGYNNIPHEIFIVLKDTKIVTDNDLTRLNGKTFTLDGSTNYGGFLDSSSKIKIGKAIGQIQFGKVEERNNWTIGSSHPYIVAGKYSMSVYTNRNFALTNGRFDYNLYRPDSTFIVY